MQIRHLSFTFSSLLIYSLCHFSFNFPSLPHTLSTLSSFALHSSFSSHTCTLNLWRRQYPVCLQEKCWAVVCSNSVACHYLAYNSSTLCRQSAAEVASSEWPLPALLLDENGQLQEREWQMSDMYDCLLSTDWPEIFSTYSHCSISNDYVNT